MTAACTIYVRGIVQGVGFRPFVYRLARANELAGWVSNGADGVEIVVEGSSEGVENFVSELRSHPPRAAQVATVQVVTGTVAGFRGFAIRPSRDRSHPSARVSPDLPICEACLAELFDPRDQRFEYPYINCTDCGPRFSIVRDIPYDRCNTTMREWPLDPFCEKQYENPADRRFHAQPLACHACGPGYFLEAGNDLIRGSAAATRAAAALLREGKILAVKGIGGYHIACDARNAAAVSEIRNRKFRREKPFAVMARNLSAVHEIAFLSGDEANVLESAARPITLLRAKSELTGVAPGNREIGVMLPYAPLHFLLFVSGAPDVLVMTSGNRSSEPIAYEDSDAQQRLAGLADAFLVGERRIARRVDDSVARVGACGPVILRRSRGLAPVAVAQLPAANPILALGADLKNAICLVVDGQAFVSQHIGDLENFQSFRAFRETIDDLLAIYGVESKALTVVHDAHPQYFSSLYAQSASAAKTVSVQHHRAHLASVLVEHGLSGEPVLGVCFDGTGYGDDGGIWGGEFFHGTLATGFSRVAHLRPALLAGGDAAAQLPVQAAAGFLYHLDALADFTAPPFCFPSRFAQALQLVRSQSRCFVTTSAGRLFDAVAALLGFTTEVTFEGQAAVAVEQWALQSRGVAPYLFPFADNELDFRPALAQIVQDRLKGRGIHEIARAFHAGLAAGVVDTCIRLANDYDSRTVAVSGGVFQNDLLLEMIKTGLEQSGLSLLANHQVPPNDGGISLGQAAIAAWLDRSLASRANQGALDHA